MSHPHCFYAAMHAFLYCFIQHKKCKLSYQWCLTLCHCLKHDSAVIFLIPNIVSKVHTIMCYDSIIVSHRNANYSCRFVKTNFGKSQCKEIFCSCSKSMVIRLILGTCRTNVTVLHFVSSLSVFACKCATSILIKQLTRFVLLIRCKPQYTVNELKITSTRYKLMGF